MTSTRYRVSGPRPVAGVAPGGTLDLDEDTDLNVAALVEAGHLTAVTAARKPAKAAETTIEGRD